MTSTKKTALLAAFFSLGAVILGAALLSGCGRRGAPELPASAYMEDGQGRQVKKPKTDKPFALDGLIR